MAQPVLLSYDPRDVLHAPITSTQTITKGDFVQITASGYVYPCSTATNGAFFAGISLDTSADGDTDQIAFVYKGVVAADCTSASYQVGAGLTFSATNSLTDDGGTQTIGWVAKQDTSATRINVIFNAIGMHKKFEKN